LLKLNPSITGISLSMFQTPGANDQMVNLAINQNHTILYDSMKRKDVLNALKPGLVNLVNNHPATFTYDPHGDKHFPGGPKGTKFNGTKQVVNPQLVNIITPNVGRIRRDANGKNQSYYLTTNGITQCPNGDDLTIQVDFNYANDTITYHGYPDRNVLRHSLSRVKGGNPIPN